MDDCILYRDGCSKAISEDLNLSSLNLLKMKREKYLFYILRAQSYYRLDFINKILK